MFCFEPPIVVEKITQNVYICSEPTIACVMIPPETGMKYDFPTSTIWMDEDGIVYSVPKPGVGPSTRAESEETIERFKEIMNYEKRCMILQSGSDPLPNKEDRKWIAKELEALTKAMAIIYTSPMGRMMANLFFGLMPASYPVKFFSNEKEAREWIRQYL